MFVRSGRTTLQVPSAAYLVVVTMNEQEAIFGTKFAKLDDTKEIKIRLPVGHLIKLHGYKILKGQNIGDTVVDALDRYFAEEGMM